MLARTDLGPCWGHVGAHLGLILGHFGDIIVRLGPSWANWADLGPFIEPSWANIYMSAFTSANQGGGKVPNVTMSSAQARRNARSD